MDCLKDYCKLIGHDRINCPRSKQIHILTFSYLDTRGPAHSRYLLQMLMKDEEFYLQIDSHTDMIPHWDSELLNMWGMIDNEYAVLSTRLPHVDALNPGMIKQRLDVPHICHSQIAER